jgi:hypothetical protein
MTRRWIWFVPLEDLHDLRRPARLPEDVLAAQRRERARVRSEKGVAGADGLSNPQPETSPNPVIVSGHSLPLTQ